MRLSHLIVFFVGFFCQKSGFFKLVFQSVHTFFIGQAPVFQNFSLPSNEKVKLKL